MTNFAIASKPYQAPDLSTLEGPILVTGTAGFIGFHTAKALLDLGHQVVGIDNISDYYDVRIKHARTDILKKYPGFSFYKEDLANFEETKKIFEKYAFKFVIHLAAQAGVRYSLTHPFPYLKSNIDGFLTLLECARHTAGFKHMAYASSSSVYGMNRKMPFSEEDPVNHPMSLYAVTKRSNELMAQSYFHLYQIPLTGLRFFTVYGPYGRPDMSAFKFLEAIFAGKPIDVYNHGNMARDFTFVGDTVMGILGSLKTIPNTKEKTAPVYNLGNNKLEKLSDFIATLEKHAGKEAIKNMLPIQPGDVPETVADITKAQQDFSYSPGTSIEEGLGYFVTWYKDYFKDTLNNNITDISKEHAARA